MKTTAIFRDEVWEIEHRKDVRIDGSEVNGSHDWSCRSIQVASGQYPKNLFEAEIHEALHALFPDVTEERITQCGFEMCNFLTGLGYKKKEPKEKKKPKK